MNEEKLKELRKPFSSNSISKLPKPTKQQTEAVRNDYRTGIRCQVCGGWHHKDVIHLDYVGHAALTDRLLDVDPAWNWEPLAYDEKGFPAIDQNGGMWIKLTVCGVTRLGYGDAQGKTGGDAMKERIGDALRNAAMRFGAALDLWHKGDLHPDENKQQERKPMNAVKISDKTFNQVSDYIDKGDDLGLKQVWHEMSRPEQEVLWKMLNSQQQTVARDLLDKKVA